MNPFDHARDVLHKEWRHNCRMIDDYFARNEMRRLQLRQDDFDGWLRGYAEALCYAALADPAWQPVRDEARALRDLWPYRCTLLLREFVTKAEEAHARSVA